MKTLQKNFLNLYIHALLGTLIGGAISEIFAVFIDLIYRSTRDYGNSFPPSRWMFASLPPVMIVGGILGGALGAIWAIKVSKKVIEEQNQKSFLVMVAYSGVGLVLGALLAVVYGAILEFIYGVIFVSQYEGVFVVLHSPSTPIIGGILGGVLSAILVIRSSKSPS
jgi:MFS family permease